MNQKERDEILIGLKQGFERHDGLLMDLKQGFERHDRLLTELKEELQSVGNIVARMEVEHGEKIQLLLETFSFQSNQLDSQKERLEACEEKIEEHDSQIFYLKSKIQDM